MVFFGIRHDFCSQPLDLPSPLHVFEKIYASCEHCFLFESFEKDGSLGRYSYLGFEPHQIIKVNDGVISIGTEELEQDPFSYLKSFCLSSKQQGFRGGLVGYLSHDAIRYAEAIKPKKSSFPDMEFGLYLDGVVFDHQQHTARYVTYGENRVSVLKEILRQEPLENPLGATRVFPSFFTKNRFMQSVAVAQEHIAAGNAFQIVLSRKFPVRIDGNKMPFYKKLRKTNPSPYQFFLKMGTRELVGSSPEMLIRVEEKHATTFPIAGTRPRGQTAFEDVKLEAELKNDKKEMAEHTMLVDLARNDIGRVSKPGSVAVKAFAQIKKFSHVQHLVSEVTGILNGTSVDGLKAVFPAGTLTGAPKLSALKIIDQLEPQARGPYGGAVGFLSLDGSCDFAISIRTLFCDGPTSFVQAGAGLVSDSVPENEFMETEYKAQTLLECLK